MTANLLLVWSPFTVIAAIVAGCATGYWIIGGREAEVAYGSLRAASRVGFVNALEWGIGVVLFFVLQALAAYVEGDVNWPRIVSRTGLWILCAACVGLGVWRRCRDYAEARHAAARIRAAREIEEGR